MHKLLNFINLCKNIRRKIVIINKVMDKKKKKLQNIIVFTDGSCMANGKLGAVGGIGIHFPDRELKDVSKIYEGKCTNQRTELYAILKTLQYINSRLGLEKYRVFIKTDSMYCINCITKWAPGWIKNGWLTKNKTPVANKELISRIYKYYVKFIVFLEHVEAHTGGEDSDSMGNDVADSLAKRASKKAIKLKLSTLKETNQRHQPSGSKTNQKYQPSGSKTNMRRPIAVKNNKSSIVVELIKSKN